MPDFTKRVRKGVAGYLHPGESVIKAVAGQPPGSLTRGVNETGDTARGFYRGRQEKKRHASEASGLAGLIPPQNVFLALTDMRLLVFTMSKLGSPEELVADFAFPQVDRVELAKGRFGSGTIDVTFADDTGVDFLVVSRQRPEEFITAWEQVRP